MATDITVRASSADRKSLEAVVARALQLFHDVEAQCTRFDESSPLMQANAAGEAWVRVPGYCFDALRAAADAYERTRGRFDPRVHADLVRLGYRNSFAQDEPRRDVAGEIAARAELPAWQPQFRYDDLSVKIGPHPVDLGGIGKGLAVRWASEILAPAAPDHIVEAGGDCYAAGSAPDGGLWNIGIEDPFGGYDPLLVVGVSDRAVATSSTRIRHWRVAGVDVHHVIDPRTGLSAEAGICAATVIGNDTAAAEVDAKVLFIDGVDANPAIAACWVFENGELGTTSALEDYVVWRRP